MRRNKMSRGQQFRSIEKPKLRRSKQDRSHEKRFSQDPFYLTPILYEECIPGENWKFGNEIVIRCNPLIAPIMHEINVYVHYYFVPYRLLWDKWEDFITGGRNGTFNEPLPSWRLSLEQPGININSCNNGSLYDFLYGHTNDDWHNFKKLPNIFGLRAYNLIWNEYYRDQNIIEEVDLDKINYGDTSGTDHKKGFRRRSWEKDYFTSALPWQQRGIAPALPIKGQIGIDDINSLTEQVMGVRNGVNMLGLTSQTTDLQQRLGAGTARTGTVASIPAISALDISSDTQAALKRWLGQIKINLNDAITFGVSELRLATQIQLFLERMARGGARYTEYLTSMFGVNAGDDRLQRPEYIGGSKTPIIISEVLQTSSSDTTSPQGNMAGHGLSADRTYINNYFIREWGCIMGLMSIMPRTMYQQGLDRKHAEDRTRFDFYHPLFANLSEQAIYSWEIYNHTTAPDSIFGYIPRYDEYRYARNTVHGLMRDDFAHWHMGRIFQTAPALNPSFLYPYKDEIQNLKRVLQVPTEDMFMISFGNKLHVTSPMPWRASPGRLDHQY